MVYKNSRGFEPRLFLFVPQTIAPMVNSHKLMIRVLRGSDVPPPPKNGLV